MQTNITNLFSLFVHPRCMSFVYFFTHLSQYNSAACRTQRERVLQSRFIVHSPPICVTFVYSEWHGIGNWHTQYYCKISEDLESLDPDLEALEPDLEALEPDLEALEPEVAWQKTGSLGISAQTAFLIQSQKKLTRAKPSGASGCVLVPPSSPVR